VKGQNSSVIGVGQKLFTHSYSTEETDQHWNKSFQSASHLCGAENVQSS